MCTFFKTKKCPALWARGFGGVSCVSLSNTICGVIAIVVRGEQQLSGSWRIDVQSSTVKTLLKYSLKSWHLSWSLSTMELSSRFYEFIDTLSCIKTWIHISSKLLNVAVAKLTSQFLHSDLVKLCNLFLDWQKSW